MNSNLCLTATAVAAVFALLAINPTRFSPPPETTFDHWKTEYVAIDGGVGPESFAFDSAGGGPYTGISDGRIIKWLPEQRSWIDFAVTSPNRTGCEEREKEEEREERCGRPLGLRFKDGTGSGDGDDLYIADAYMGLLRVGANGGLAKKLDFQTEEDEVWKFGSLKFANGLDIDQLSGLIYFTDSSSHYQRRNFASAILSGDNSGRLMKYDPKTKQLSLLLGNLSFPNGVSVSKNSEFLVLAETTKCRIVKYWLKTAKAGRYEVIAELPGFPDNIKTSHRGGFWVGIHSRKPEEAESFASRVHRNQIEEESLFPLFLLFPSGRNMRRYSPPYHSPPRRGYGGRGRSPPGRGYGGGGGGGYGRRREQPHGSLLVRNIPMDCRPEELRVPFERFGLVRDVYIPKDYYTGEPRGFAFVEFVDPYEASEAQYHMNGKKFAGREITVVLAAESRKRPEQMRQRSRRGPSSYGGRRSHYGRSRSRSLSRSRSPRHPSGSRSRYRSRSYSPAPRWRGDYSVSPGRRHADYPESPRGAPRERDGERSRQVYSPGYDNANDHDHNGNGNGNGNGYHDKSAFEGEDARANWRSSPGRTSRSPSGSRSRSADASPRHGR